MKKPACGELSIPVYFIAEISVTDPETYAVYLRKVRDTVENHGGRYLARGGTVVPIGGGWHPERLVVIEFPSFDRMNAWLSSEEYRALAPLREASAQSRAAAVEGLGS
jgi:uncharacterized protein (DUF1330 family)